MKERQLSVIIPTYNEKDNIEEILNRLEKTLKNISYEVIFVDDDSPDGTAELIREQTKRKQYISLIHRLGRRGLAGAVIEGILSSKSEICAVIDCDLQHDETKLSEMYSLFEKKPNLDLVVGSRFLNEGDISLGAFSYVRRLGSNLATFYTKKLLGIKISDPLSGFFMVKRKSFEQYSKRLQTQGFKVLADLVASARQNFVTEEVSYKFKSRYAGESKMTIATGLELLGLIISQIFNGNLSIRFILFCFVGLSGVLIQLLVTGIFMNFSKISFDIAQTFGIVSAMTTNYFFNNLLTFRDRSLKYFELLKGLITFYLICSLGALANFALAHFLYSQLSNWLIASLGGAIFSAIWNFTLSSMFTWKIR